ncbi:MAG: cytidine deaminase [Alphaproteobacteria bacterium]|nr:cytidine deaminase [Alphaproteobacteria bacterium]
MKQQYKALVKVARDLIKKRYCEKGHHTVVACALETKSGKVYSALNVGTYQPSIATCAEIIAIGMALKDDPKMTIKAIVSVRDKEGYIVSSCGRCREYISDYGPKAVMLVPTDDADGYEPVPINDLLPYKYSKR